MTRERKKTIYRMVNGEFEVYKNFRKYRRLVAFARRVGIRDSLAFKIKDGIYYVGAWVKYKNKKIGVIF